MKCSKCNKEWPEGVKFCGDCGMKLPEPMVAATGSMTMDRAAVVQQVAAMLPRVGIGNFQQLEPGHWILQRGSTHVDIQVINFNNMPAVRSVAPVTIGSSLDAGLMRFLLEKNAEFIFGAFGVDPRGVVFFTHTILATSVDPAELAASVNTVLSMADQHDDLIVARWGGKTMRQTAIENALTPRVLELLRAAQARAGIQ
jgi:hypothetical protein